MYKLPHNCIHLKVLTYSYAGQEETVRTGHGTTDWFQIGKRVYQDCILSPCLFNLYTKNIMRNTGLEKNTSWNQDCQEKYQSPQICRWQHPYGKKWRWTKKPLDETERGEWISCLKTQHSENKEYGIQSYHFMANRRGNSGNSDRLYFGGPQKTLQMVTAAIILKDACSLEEKLWPT